MGVLLQLDTSLGMQYIRVAMAMANMINCQPFCSVCLSSNVFDPICTPPVSHPLACVMVSAANAFLVPDLQIPTFVTAQVCVWCVCVCVCVWCVCGVWCVCVVCVCVCGMWCVCACVCVCVCGACVVCVHACVCVSIYV